MGRRDREYYLPSLIFAAGVLLVVVGLALIAIFQINRYSSPIQIEITGVIIGIAIPMALYGVNAMYGFKRYRPATVAAFVLTSLAVILFVLMYPEYWYYPQVVYVALIYTIGLVLFFSSSFAEAVLRLLEKTPVIEVKREKPSTYAEKKKLKKEIESEIDMESAKLIEPDFDRVLNIEIVEPKTDFEVGVALKSAEYRGNVVRVKDSVPEAEELKKLKEGGRRVRKKELNEVDDAARILKMIEDSKIRGKGSEVSGKSF
ncbi:MAG: hypothetical protein DSY33_04625 [Archaeoglobus sp.]|nr:MAG: hypothetical protein DSY33_04625 [Archaeoglobus sp.]